MRFGSRFPWGKSRFANYSHSVSSQLASTVSWAANCSRSNGWSMDRYYSSIDRWHYTSSMFTIRFNPIFPPKKGKIWSVKSKSFKKELAKPIAPIKSPELRWDTTIPHVTATDFPSERFPKQIQPEKIL